MRKGKRGRGEGRESVKPRHNELLWGEHLHPPEGGNHAGKKYETCCGQLQGWGWKGEREGEHDEDRREKNR